MDNKINELLEQILIQLKRNNDEQKEYMEEGVWRLEDRLNALEDTLQDIIHAVENLEK